MLAALDTGTQTYVTAGLTNYAITVPTKGSNKLFSAKIARKFQAGMTSSLYHMKPDYLRFGILREVTRHGVAQHRF